MNRAEEGNLDRFQHTITGHVNEDSNGRLYVKFSTYLSFLKLTCRVYVPEPGEDSTRVYVSFGLKRRDNT